MWYLLDGNDLGDYLQLSETWTTPLLLYATWLSLHLFFTEYLLVDQLSADPELMTLMRLLSKNNNRRPVPRLVVNLCRRIGVLGQTETVHQDAAKAKIIFVLFHFIHSMIMTIPTPFLYRNFSTGGAYIVFVFGLSIWRGADITASRKK